MTEDVGAAGEATHIVKRMKLRYAGTCSRCGAPLAAGVTADYNQTSKTVACVECPARRAMPERAEQSAAPRHAITLDAPPELEVVDGTAGGSAAREFDRRHEARQQRVQANHPKIGKFLLAVFDDPQFHDGVGDRRGRGTATRRHAGRHRQSDRPGTARPTYPEDHRKHRPPCRLLVRGLRGGCQTLSGCPPGTRC